MEGPIVTPEDEATLHLASGIMSAIARAIDGGLAEEAIAGLLHDMADALSSGELEQFAEALER
jgi:HD superfamily phosphohydrolase YqeK